MSIGNDSKIVLLTKDSNTTALKNTTKYIYPFDPCTVYRVQAYVDVIADADITITITREAILGGTSTAITTLTVPNTTAVGKVVYKDITPVDLSPGQVLKYVVSNSGTSTALILSAVVIPRAEMAANLGNMVASA
jgi:hypothetical protein